MKDTAGQKTLSTIVVPVTDLSLGQKVNVSYSSDMNTWTHLDDTIVI